MGYLLSADIMLAAKDENSSVFKVLSYIALNSDDKDSDDDTSGHAQSRGRNFYHSLTSIARELGTGVRNVKRAIKTLKEKGWIREYPTSRYLESYDPSISTTARCYEINLSMLARRLDIRKIINKHKVEPGTDLYKAMINCTSFQEDDWKTRIWKGKYVPRSLDWDGDVDSLTPDLWKKDQKSDDHTEHQSVTNEEINTIANRHRIQ